MERGYDYVVVGGGAAGCVVAARLSEDARAHVLLVEAGPADSNPLLAIPGANFFAGAAPAINWDFATEPVPGLNNRTLQWRQGKVLGGSSTINGMIYARGHSREYDAWEREFGCRGWGAEGVLPYFRKSENSARGADRWHGDAGPIRTKPASLVAPITDLFLAAAADAGFPLVDDLNADTVEGFGRFDMNIGGGRRSSAARAYLRPARRRRNLTVLTKARVMRVLIEKGRAVGIEAATAGDRLVVRADREVILCGGAINSPQLLMLSGVGPAGHLREAGIALVADRNEVGQNVQNHPAYRMHYALSEPISAYRYLSPWRSLWAGIEYLAARRGILGESFCPAGGYIRTDARLTLPDVQTCMAHALTMRSGAGRFGLLPRRHGFTLLVNQGTPRSRGTIRLRSSDPLDPPRIFPNYFSEAQDMAVLVAAVGQVREIVRQPRLAACIEAELEPGSQVRTAAEIEADIRANCGTHFHYAGSCRMGGDEGSVVDPQLRVRGVDGLRIADASVMPLLPNANTHAVTLMIAEKASALISGKGEVVP